MLQLFFFGLSNLFRGTKTWTGELDITYMMYQ